MPNTALGGLAAKLKLIRAQAEDEVPVNTLTDESPPDPESVPVPVGPEPGGPQGEPFDDVSDAEVDVPPVSDDEDDDGYQEDEDDDPIDMFQELLREEEDGPELDIMSQIIEPEPQAAATEEEEQTADAAPTDDETKACLIELLESYFRINKNPSDEQFHALATSLGMDKEVLETVLFGLVGDAVSDESVGVHEID